MQISDIVEQDNVKVVAIDHESAVLSLQLWAANFPFTQTEQLLHNKATLQDPTRSWQ